MLKDSKRVRFPRTAIARRLLKVVDQLRQYASIYEEGRWGLEQRADRELYEERYEFLDELSHELEYACRSLQYWR